MTPKEIAESIVSTWEEGHETSWPKTTQVSVAYAYLALLNEHEKVIGGVVGAIEDAAKARYIAVQESEVLKQALASMEGK